MLRVKYFQEHSFYRNFDINSLELDENITEFNPAKHTNVENTLRYTRGIANFLNN